MKKYHIIAAVITLASGMSAFGQDSAAPSLSKLEALAKQTTPPAVHDAAGFQAEGAVRPIFFDALDWEGKPTRVFAWIGLPAGASKEKPVPGIVLVHGGGGTAFKDWVQKWNAEGFAAISIAVEGQTDIKPLGKKIASNSGNAMSTAARPAPAYTETRQSPWKTSGCITRWRTPFWPIISCAAFRRWIPPRLGSWAFLGVA